MGLRGVPLGLRLPFGLSRALDGAKRPHALATLWRAARVMTWCLHEQRLRAHPPDVLLRPKVEHCGVFAFGDLNGLVLAGASEAEHQLAGLTAITRVS